MILAFTVIPLVVTMVNYDRILYPLENSFGVVQQPFRLWNLYGIMTEELVIREIRIDEVAVRGDSDSRMTSFEVIMPLKLQSTKY